MSEKKNHNPVYFLTTLSVYLGLVIVGASPQLLAQVENVQNIQTSRFELGSRNGAALAGLEKRSVFDRQDVLPFTLFGAAAPRGAFRDRRFSAPVVNAPAGETFAENEQVFVVSSLPRADL